MNGLLTQGVTYLADIPSPPRGVLHLGPLPLRAYAFCIIIGIVVGVLWGNRRFVARGGRPGRVTDIAVFAVPFGLIGGRLYHVITDNELYFRPGKNPWRAFAIWDGGLGIWGAIALGGFGAWLGCRYYKVPLSAFADSVAPGVIVAQAIGRLGNYFNQELFGAKTSLPWGLDVYLRTPGGVAGTLAQCPAVPEFPTDYIKATPTVLCGTYQPTFLYELLWNLLIAAVLVWADRKFRLGRGQVFWLYVAGYTLGRGWIEMLRIDTANHFLGLRINVFTSIIMFVVAVVVLFVRRHVGREDPALLQGRPPKVEPDRSGTGGEADSDLAARPRDDGEPSDEPRVKTTVSEQSTPETGAAGEIPAGSTADQRPDAE
ncbi:prolipoprotein diacylglyceryl transferase [Nakamurella panacisegetis]|uniref:Phosphatidylglycerol--prolipoprotein diacylglyceryl transferase n=1 Tax=Nakamurella panacisegetis TaxID=1090615 RepID=A0A1H0RQ99_9ACTN|nr:prolipoprotein diacylglyceryl transferase [Nakamurella panacisegetis]SDP31136.1 prolipoprotein diacylglyceryl transferase [Nakamurella panacisegetis]